MPFRQPEALTLCRGSTARACVELQCTCPLPMAFCSPAQQATWEGAAMMPSASPAKGPTVPVRLIALALAEGGALPDKPHLGDQEFKSRFQWESTLPCASFFGAKTQTSWESRKNRFGAGLQNLLPFPSLLPSRLLRFSRLEKGHGPYPPCPHVGGLPPRTYGSRGGALCLF